MTRAVTQHRGLAGLALAGLAMAWLLGSAASRGQGVYPFLLIVAALGLALFAFRLGRRRILYGLLYALVLASATALVFEGLLHVWPGVLRGHVANVAYTGYHWCSGGIYRLDAHRGPVLRPSVSRWMYWNEHWWWHATNADGYRGPRRERADVVLLGDSMIYGHGVDQADTVAARLAARTGLAVANLGQQGTCQLRSLLTLRAHGRRLAPRTVCACLHFSDVDDSLSCYRPRELGRFLLDSSEQAEPPYVREAYQPRPFWNPRQLFATDLALPLRCAGIVGPILRSARRRGPALLVAASRDPFVPTPEELSAAFPAPQPEAPPDLALSWRVQRRAVQEMRHLCDAIGARLVIFDLGYPQEFSRAVEDMAHDLGVEYSAAGRVALRSAIAGQSVYLADDGHWTGTGAQAVADELAQKLAR